MNEFRFRAPSLFQSHARPSEELEGILHDAPGMAVHLAQIEAIARWLLGKLNELRVDATGLGVDESGWIIEGPSTIGFSTCILSGHEIENAHIHALVTSYGGAGHEFGNAISTILRSSPEIVDLQISD
jgi:hypothetical protein